MAMFVELENVPDQSGTGYTRAPLFSDNKFQNISVLNAERACVERSNGKIFSPGLFSCRELLGKSETRRSLSLV